MTQSPAINWFFKVRDCKSLHTAGFAFAVNLILFTAFAMFASPCYETNDDLGMMRTASGLRSGEPSEYLVFSNILIGQVLKRLYQATDTINWYSLYLYFAHFVACTSLLFVFLRRHCSALSVFLFLLLFVTFELRLLLVAQFTSTAAVLAISGLLMVLLANADEEDLPFFVPLLGILWIVLAAMIRDKACLLAMLISTPLVLNILWVFRSKRIILFLCASVVLSFAAIGYNRAVYLQHDGWRQYLEFNSVRGQIHGNPIGDALFDTREGPYYHKLGWSQNDAAMFYRWFFADDKIYSTDKLKRIVDHFSSASRPSGERLQYLRRQLDRVAPYIYATLFNVLLGVGLGYGQRLRVARVPLLTILFATMVIVFLAASLRLPDRVTLSALFIINAIIFFWCLSAHHTAPVPKYSDSWLARTVKIGLLVVLLFGYEFSLYYLSCDLIRLNDANRQDQQSYARLIDDLTSDFAQSGQQPVFVVWGAAFPYEWTPLFSDNRALSHLPIINLGWSTHSPLYRQSLKRHSIENIYQALYERPDVYLIAWNDALPLLVTFVEEHFGETIMIESIRTYMNNFPSRSGQIYVTVSKAFRKPKTTGSN